MRVYLYLLRTIPVSMFINENNLKELPQADVIPPSLELDSAASVRGDIFIMEEIWKPIKEFNGHYECSNLGNFRCWYEYESSGNEIKLEIPRPLTQILTSQGYLTIQLRIKKGKSWNYRTHRLIAAAFYDNPYSHPQVNHINGVKTDNRIVNLEWCSVSHNMKHAWANNLIKVGREGMVKNNKLTKEQAVEIYNSSLSYKNLQKKYGVSRATIQRVKMAQSWCFAIGNIPNRQRNRRLTKDEVLAVYNSVGKSKIIADLYKISQWTVQRIRGKQCYFNVFKSIS